MQQCWGGGGGEVSLSGFFFKRKKNRRMRQVVLQLPGGGGRGVLPGENKKRGNNPPPPPLSPVACNKDDTFMLCLLVHLSCVKWSVLQLSFVVCHKERCTWIAFSTPLKVHLISYSTNYRQSVITMYERHEDYGMFFQVSCFNWRLFSDRGHTGKNGNMSVTEEHMKESNRLLHSYYIAWHDYTYPYIYIW